MKKEAIMRKAIIKMYKAYKAGQISRKEYVSYVIRELEPYIDSLINSKHRNDASEYEDLMQQGRLAILESVDSYDPKKTDPIAYFSNLIDQYQKEITESPIIPAYYTYIENKLELTAIKYGYKGVLDPELEPEHLAHLANVSLSTVNEIVNMEKEINYNPSDRYYERFKSCQSCNFRTRNIILRRILASTKGNISYLIRNYIDVVDVVDAIIPQSDKLVDKGAKKLLQAAISYLCCEYPPEKYEILNLKQMINMGSAEHEDDPIECSPLDMLFEDLRKRDKDNTAVQLYDDFKTLRYYDRAACLFIARDSLADFVYNYQYYHFTKDDIKLSEKRIEENNVKDARESLLSLKNRIANLSLDTK